MNDKKNQSTLVNDLNGNLNETKFGSQKINN